MDEPANIDDLLKVDAACANESVLVFAALGPNAIEGANAGLRVFAAAARFAHHLKNKRAASDEFNTIAEELGMDGHELSAMIKLPPPASGEDARVAKARAIDKEVEHALAARTLLHLCWRCYRWGLTDLRRLRLTASSAYARVEAESLALMLLFMNEPKLAERWINPKEDMVRFFRETQPLVKDVLKAHKLLQAYDHGSVVAQHARFASAARGMRLPHGDVLDQEFDPEEPVSFHLGLGLLPADSGAHFGRPPSGVCWPRCGR